MESPSPGERIRPSAVIILYRRAPDLEVFLVERSQKTRFFPGYHAFPGGVLDPGESDRALAGIRELAEETTVRVEVGALRQAATLLTPPFGPMRYDTTFFFCEMPQGQTAVVDGEELVSGAWLTPREALRRFEQNAFPIPPPTIAFLRALESYGDVTRVADESRALDGSPHHERFRIEMHPGVYVMPLRAPTLPPAITQNCYVLDGDPILVIDPGSPRADQWDALHYLLDELLGRQPRTAAVPAGTASVTADGREVVIALTHHHGDHVSAVAATKARYHATVVAHRATQDLLPRHLVDEAIEDEYEFDLGVWAQKPWVVRALFTPGHAPGHLAFRDERWGAIFAGDLVSGVSTILIDPVEGDMGAYLKSLQRMADLKPMLVLPGHGPVMPSAAFAKAIEHRKVREGKVVAALSKGPATIAELLPTVYDDTPEQAWPLAARSMESILKHLEKTGRARRDGESWSRSP